MDSQASTTEHLCPWNKGRLVGQTLPLELREIWAIRMRLQLSEHSRDLALFNLAIDSKLRGCDLVSLRVRDIGQTRSNAVPQLTRWYLASIGKVANALANHDDMIGPLRTTTHAFGRSLLPSTWGESVESVWTEFAEVEETSA
jgi:hypothetical protein